MIQQRQVANVTVAHRLPEQHVLGCTPPSWDDIHHLQLMAPLKHLDDGPLRHLHQQQAEQPSPTSRQLSQEKRVATYSQALAICIKDVKASSP